MRLIFQAGVYRYVVQLRHRYTRPSRRVYCTVPWQTPPQTRAVTPVVPGVSMC